MSFRTLFSIAILSMLTLPLPSQGQFTYSNFSDTTGLNFVGSAAQSGSRIRIVPATPQQIGLIWYQTAQNVSTAFTTEFAFQYSGIGGIRDTQGNIGCDGISFQIQPLSNTQDYSHSINPSLDVWFDAYDNGDGEVSSSRINVFQNGNLIGQTDVEPLGIVFRNQTIYNASINYDGSALHIRINGQFIATYTGIELGSISPGFVGFGGYVGNAYANQDVLNWSFAPISNIGGIIALQGTQDAVQPVDFTFRPTTGSAFTRTVTLNTNGGFGTYNLNNIPAGQYTVSIKGAKWLRKNISVDARTGNVTNANATLLAGDANNDNFADIADLLLLINAYNNVSPASGYSEAADFNCDGTDDIADLLLLILNYNRQGDSLP